MLSSYAFDMYSTYFRNVMTLITNLVATPAECSASLVYVLGKRRRDEDDEGDVESPCKRRCIRSPFWAFEPWPDRVESLVTIEEHLEKPEIVDY